MKKLILLTLLPLFCAATLAPQKVKWVTVNKTVNLASFKMPEGYSYTPSVSETLRSEKYEFKQNDIFIMVSITDIEMVAFDYKSKANLVEVGLESFINILGDYKTTSMAIKDNRGHPGKFAVLENKDSKINYWVLIGDNRMYQFVTAFPATSNIEGDKMTRKLFKSVKLFKSEH